MSITSPPVSNPHYFFTVRQSTLVLKEFHFWGNKFKESDFHEMLIVPMGADLASP